MKRRDVDAGIAIAFVFAAFLLRTLPGAGDVLGSESVRFRTPDPLYHMRAADLLVERFPRPVRHDALLLWPRGQDLSSGPLFDYLIATPAVLLGRGHPSRRLLDLCGAFLPPILGGLLTGAFWLLGRAPFGRAGAALAASLAAVMPGQLLQRTALGYADHHAAALLSLGLFLLFLVRAAAERDETRSGHEATRAGAALALLVLSWPWGAAFAAAAALWATLDGALRRGSRALARLARATAVAAGPVLLAALLFPVLGKPGAALVLISIATAAGSRAKTPTGRFLVPAAVILATTIAGAVVFPELPRELALRLRPSPAGMTVGEAKPLFSTGAGLAPPFRELWTGLFAALYGAGLAVRSLRSRPESGLLLLFLGVTGLLAIAQSRFSGEAAIVAALLGGLVPAHLMTGAEEVSRGQAEAGRALVLAGLVTLLVVPAALVAPEAIRRLPPEDPDWEAAMSWLRANSPDPYSPPAPDGSARYSVLSWWDNGYRIVRLGRRVPVTNPTQEEAAWAARALLVEDEAGADSLLASRAVGYVALDAAFPFSPLQGSDGFAGQFPALPVWAGVEPGRYSASVRTGDAGAPTTTLFFADYFRTLGFRLYRHGGVAASPVGPVLAFRPAEVRSSAELRRFPSWEEADRFVRSAGAPWRLASEDPLSTCVPLEAWPRFHRVYSSPRDALRGPEERVARVEILARVP